jgi:hypothetical protein
MCAKPPGVGGGIGPQLAVRENLVAVGDTLVGVRSGLIAIGHALIGVGGGLIGVGDRLIPIRCSLIGFELAGTPTPRNSWIDVDPSLRPMTAALG